MDEPGQFRGMRAAELLSVNGYPLDGCALRRLRGFICESLIPFALGTGHLRRCQDAELQATASHYLARLLAETQRIDRASDADANFRHMQGSPTPILAA